jgi:hypothetical protein
MSSRFLEHGVGERRLEGVRVPVGRRLAPVIPLDEGPVEAVEAAKHPVHELHDGEQLRRDAFSA